MKCQSRLRNLEKSSSVGKQRWVIIFVPYNESEREQEKLREEMKNDFLTKYQEAKDLNFVFITKYGGEVSQPILW